MRLEWCDLSLPMITSHTFNIHGWAKINSYQHPKTFSAISISVILSVAPCDSSECACRECERNGTPSPFIECNLLVCGNIVCRARTRLNEDPKAEMNAQNDDEFSTSLFLQCRSIYFSHISACCVPFLSISNGAHGCYGAINALQKRRNHMFLKWCML